MWIYQAANKNRTIIISIYLLSICIGIYSLWYAHSNYSFFQLVDMYTPLLFSIGAILILLLLFGYRSQIFIFVIYLLSLYILTFLFAGFHGLELTEVLVIAHLFLLYVWTFHFLLMLERNKLLLFSLMKATIFSIFFFIFLLIFNLVPSLFIDFVILFLYGQALSILILFFYALFSFSDLFISTTKNVDNSPIISTNSPRRKRSSRFFLVSLRIIYSLLIGICLFILYTLTEHWFLLLLIWICSLFIASASFNSFLVAYNLHTLTLAFLIPWSVVLFLFDQGLLFHREALLHSLESEVLFGVLICWAIGLTPILIYKLTRTKLIKLYSIPILSFLIIISSLFFVTERVEAGFSLAFSFMLSFIFIYIIAYLQLVLEEKVSHTSSRKKRKTISYATNNKARLEKSRNEEVAYDKSTEERERDLAVSYRKLLERRETRLFDEGIKKDD